MRNNSAKDMMTAESVPISNPWPIKDRAMESEKNVESTVDTITASAPHVVIVLKYDIFPSLSFHALQTISIVMTVIAMKRLLLSWKATDFKKKNGRKKTRARKIQRLIFSRIPTDTLSEVSFSIDTNN